MSNRAEEATKEIYKDGIQLVGRRNRNNNIVIHPETMVGVLRNAAQRGYEQAEKDILSIIESRLSELLGDAQPTPILRYELLDLIKKIKEEE